MQVTSMLQNRSHAAHATSMSAATPVGKDPRAAALAAANEAAAAAAAEADALKAALAESQAAVAALKMEAEKRRGGECKSVHAGARQLAHIASLL